MNGIAAISLISGIVMLALGLLIRALTRPGMPESSGSASGFHEAQDAPEEAW